MPPKPKTTRKTAKKDAPIEIQEIVQAKSPITIDYPQAGETVTSASYTFRIGAQDAAKVEISIDNSPWQPCRSAVGFWWYDWSDFGPGSHQARIQLCGANGAILAVASRQIDVKKSKG